MSPEGATMSIPVPELPDTRLQEPDDVPPIVADEPLTRMPTMPLPRAVAPWTSVPTKLPSTSVDCPLT